VPDPDTDDLIAPGWDVYDSDGERIGAVDEVTGTHVKIAGEIGRDLFIPLSAVEAAAGGHVTLDTPASEVTTMGWDRPPSADSSGPSRAS
jgi:hypothetical protein